MDRDITTIGGEVFSWDDHCRLAWLVHIRFGRDTKAGAAAWRRLLQNNCTEQQFKEMVNEGALLAIKERTRR